MFTEERFRLISSALSSKATYRVRSCRFAAASANAPASVVLELDPAGGARSSIWSLFVLLALGLWILAGPALLAKGDDPDALNKQVTQLIEQGKYQEAIPIAERAVEVAKRSSGPEHPETGAALDNFGLLFTKIADYGKAEPPLQEALQIRQKVLGPEHPDTPQSLKDLAVLYLDTHEYAKAEPLLKEALRIRQKVLGPGHPDTAQSLNELAVLYLDTHEYAKAEPLLKEALRIRQKARRTTP